MRLSLALLALALLGSPLQGDEKLDFNRDIRPILSNNCFKCHGPDEKERKGSDDAGLRLDVEEAAKRDLGGFFAIVPGTPEESELVRRITSSDEAEVMPPKDSGKQLTPAQIELLTRWVKEGAPYARHWAWVRPVRHDPPPVSDATWPKNAIDHFVLARLEREGFRPSPQADRLVLARRLYLDLIGLPPTPEEADAFASDASPRAYEELVDRLLRSPQYGERWARKWLDLARYADTNGYEKDRPRSIWPYRDWVIKALNDDMPFDVFTIRQLAGDMLPDATQEDLVATGFHRNTMLNEEGGIDPLEFRFHAMVDRVATTGATWLGLTIGCAQCHTHKFDPLTHTEYYQLMGLMNNADEPELELQTAELEAQRKPIEQRIAALEAELPNKLPSESRDKLLADWTAKTENEAVAWQELRPTSATSNLPILTVLDDNSVFSTGDITKSDTYEVKLKPEAKGITAIRLEGIPDPRLPKHGPGRVYFEGPLGDFALSNLMAEADGRPLKFNDAVQSFADGKHVAKNAFDDNLQTVWGINGGQGRHVQAIFIFSEPVDASELTIRMLFERHYAAALGRFRISVTTDPQPGRSVMLPPDVNAALVVTPADRTPRQNDAIFKHFLSVTPELAAARKEIDDLRATLPKPDTTLVMREWPQGRKRTMVRHHRGEFLQPKEPVEPDVPEFLPGLPDGAERNRLEFAKWIVSHDNPLTARVTVNRHWQTFFGRGLVRTVEDFGFQGELPSHPELLDHLAVEFMDDGWSIKRLHKRIVMSAAYQQSSRAAPELVERDAGNVLLARSPRFRYDAEVLRDSALKAADLLSAKMYGPSVYPPQPPSVTTEGAYGQLPWTASQGEDRFRRSLYTFMKRTTPFALYNTFDAPSGEACVVRREVSNTPLQGLSLLNDTVFLEAHQALGRSIAAAEGDASTKSTRLFRRCLTRLPTVEEQVSLTAFVDKVRARLASGQLDAAKIAGAGEGDPRERALWTLVARAVLNLDEAVTKN